MVRARCPYTPDRVSLTFSLDHDNGDSIHVVPQLQEASVGPWITPPVLERDSSFLLNGPLQSVSGAAVEADPSLFDVEFKSQMVSFSGKVAVQSRGDFLVEFVPLEVGVCEATIKYDGQSLLHKPFIFHVRSAASYQVSRTASELTTLVRSATSPRRGY